MPGRFQGDFCEMWATAADPDERFVPALDAHIVQKTTFMGIVLKDRVPVGVPSKFGAVL